MLEFFNTLNTFPEGQIFLANLLITSHTQVSYFEVIQHYHTIEQLYRLQNMGLLDPSWQYYAMPVHNKISYRCDGVLVNNEMIQNFIAIQYKYKHISPEQFKGLNFILKAYIDTHIIQIGTDSSELYKEQLKYLIDYSEFVNLSEQMYIKDYSYIYEQIDKDQVLKILNKYNLHYNVKDHNKFMMYHYNLKSYLPLENGLKAVARLFLK